MCVVCVVKARVLCVADWGSAARGAALIEWGVGVCWGFWVVEEQQQQERKGGLLLAAPMSSSV